LDEEQVDEEKASERRRRLLRLLLDCNLNVLIRLLLVVKIYCGVRCEIMLWQMADGVPVLCWS
jgi:hypothetical protein